jgi:hypothetical protein
MRALVHLELTHAHLTNKTGSTRLTVRHTLFVHSQGRYIKNRAFGGRRKSP